MRLDSIKMNCPKCRATLDLNGDVVRIPPHFLDEEHKGVMVEYNEVSQIMVITFRKLCRLSGAQIERLGLGNNTVIP